MSKPKNPSAASVKAYPAPDRKKYSSAQMYASACKGVSEARIAFDKKRKAAVSGNTVPTPRVKLGTSKEAANERRLIFALAFIANGRNGTKAAITAGFAEKGAGVTASELLKEPKVQALITANTNKAAAIASLSVERTLQELSRLAYSDPRRLYDEFGQLIPIHQMDDDTAATIASIEVDEIKAGDLVIGQSKKYKQWDKKGALDMVMRHLGQYEKDNEQLKGDNLNVNVVFKSPKSRG